MFCSALELQQVQKGVARDCEAGLSCKSGPPERVDEDDPQLDGDVGDTMAMNNHKLLKASRNGDVQGIVKMLQRGASIETRRPFVMTCDAMSPVHAATDGPGQVARAAGLTPLMYAAQGGYEQACQVLLQHGASANAQDEDGMRPLHYAAYAADAGACRALLSGGAKLRAMDDDGMIALDHVPAEEMTTSAEKSFWWSILGPEEPQRSLESPALFDHAAKHKDSTKNNEVEVPNCAADADGAIESDLIDLGGQGDGLSPSVQGLSQLEGTMVGSAGVYTQ